MLDIWKTSNRLEALTLSTLIKGTWLNLVSPTEAEITATAVKTGVPSEVLRAALDEEETSRLELEDEYLLVIINIPVRRSDTVYDTLPLGIIMTAEHTITVCLEANPILNEFSPENHRSFDTAKRTRFLFQILYRTATLFLRHLTQISRLTDQVDGELRKSLKNRDLFQLLDLQKGLTFFTTSLHTNGMVLDKLLRLRSNNQNPDLIKPFEEDEDLLEDVIIENNQAIQMVEMYTHILASMTDSFASIISNNLNIVMKLLASMTIILAVPTMLASFWGMNVSVPFSTGTPHGFLYVSGLAVILTGISAFILWKKDMF